MLFLPRRLLVFAWILPTVLALAPAPSFPVFYDSTNHFHRDISYHPEQPARITKTIQALQLFKEESGAPINLVDIAETPEQMEGVSTNSHRPFSKEELAHARDMLLQVHTSDLVLKLEEKCKLGKERREKEGKPSLGHMGYIDADTFFTTETFNVCLRATAAWIRATETGGIALTRPPGHHATNNEANGFCFYNFAAAAAVHAVNSSPQQLKVSVLDWDVHYGQGVADILQNHKQTRYVSLHQTPAFPYMGESFEVQGKYKNVMTIPIKPGTNWENGYADLYEKALDFICKSEEWEPDVVIICAGYDALGSDELASCELTASDFGKMTRLLHERVKSVCHNKEPKIMLGLEGGYQLAEGFSSGNLQEAVVESVKALVEQKVMANSTH